MEEDSVRSIIVLVPSQYDCAISGPRAFFKPVDWTGDGEGSECLCLVSKVRFQKQIPRTSMVQPRFISGRTPMTNTNVQNIRQAIDVCFQEHFCWISELNISATRATDCTLYFK